jgi:hypothetical protein
MAIATCSSLNDRAICTSFEGDAGFFSLTPCGERPARSKGGLYEAAQSMLRSKKWSWLKAWAMQIARRRGMKKAIVALARRLAVIMCSPLFISMATILPNGGLSNGSPCGPDRYCDFRCRDAWRDRVVMARCRDAVLI